MGSLSLAARTDVSSLASKVASMIIGRFRRRFLIWIPFPSDNTEGGNVVHISPSDTVEIWTDLFSSDVPENIILVVACLLYAAEVVLCGESCEFFLGH